MYLHSHLWLQMFVSASSAEERDVWCQDVINAVEKAASHKVVVLPKEQTSVSPRLYCTHALIDALLLHKAWQHIVASCFNLLVQLACHLHTLIFTRTACSLFVALLIGRSMKHDRPTRTRTATRLPSVTPSVLRTLYRLWVLVQAMPIALHRRGPRRMVGRGRSRKRPGPWQPKQRRWQQPTPMHQRYDVPWPLAAELPRLLLLESSHAGRAEVRATQLKRVETWPKLC